MLHTEPGPRLLALLGVALVFIFYRPGADPSLINSALLPLIGLLSAWYLTGSIVAIAFAVMLLAAAHTDLGGSRTTETLIYPLLTAGAAVTLVVVLSLRFRAAMRRRGEARRQARRENGEPTGEGG